MKDTSLRLVTMLQLIPRRAPGVSRAEISEKLEYRGYEVSDRTVQRDLVRLSAEYPLLCDEQSTPRWYWAPNAPEITLPGHDAFSALTWQLIEQHLKPLLPPALAREAQAHIESARDYLNRESVSQYRRWVDRVRVLPRSMQLLPPDTEPGVFERIYEGLLKSRQLAIDYQSRVDGARRSMRIHPLAMVVRDSVQYLIVTIDDFDDLRQLAMHRVLSAELLEQPAREPKGFNLDAYISEGHFSYSYGSKIKLVLKFDPYTAQHLKETPLSPDQRIRELPDGQIEISAHVDDSDQLRWWLLGFGENVEVLKPVALRRHMRDISATLLSRYQS